MALDEAILVKVDKRTKDRMSKAGGNWSAKIRTFIEKELARKQNIVKAELLRSRLFRISKGKDSTEVIREMRDSRYGRSGS